MKFLSLLLALSAATAFAHPGHDHGSWTAPIIHFIWLLPLAIAAIVLVLFISKKLKNK